MYTAGVVGTGNDDTELVQEAFDDLRSTGGVLELFGQINVTKLNFTCNHSVSLRGQGVGCTVLNPIGNVNAVMDISGSWFMSMADFRLGMQSNPGLPAVGIMALQTAGMQMNWLRLRDIYIDGKYDVAALYVSGVASSRADGIAVWNRQPSRYAMVLAGDNPSNMISEFTPVAKHGPMSDWLFSGCEVHHQTEPGETPGYALMLRGAREIGFVGGNISGYGSELVTIGTASDGTECDDLHFYKQTYYSEPGQAPFTHAFNALGHVNRMSVRGCKNLGANLIANAQNISNLTVN